MADNTILTSVNDAETASAEQEGTAIALRTEVDQVIITDQLTYESAAELLKTIKNTAAKIDTERKKLKAPVLEAGKRIDDLFREPLKACSGAESILKQKISFYLKEQERKRQEAERIARQAAEKERRRVEELAKKAEKRGDTEKAESFQAKAAAVVAPIVAPIVEKVAGIAQTETWRAELIGLPAVIRAAADGNKLALMCLLFNQVEANRNARVLKDTMQIPGVKVIKETGIAASKRG